MLNSNMLLELLITRCFYVTQLFQMQFLANVVFFVTLAVCFKYGSGFIIF